MHNLKPKKALGQHFLRDTQAISRIVASLQATAADQVVEIGPGEGVLTLRLMPLYPRLTAVEVDDDAVALLGAHPELRGLTLVHADVLRWDLAQAVPEAAFFIGNLPYNISSPFFFMLLAHRARVREGVFMIQKEVADRICAGPGSKTYGILSVLLQTYFEVKYLFSVPPGAFRPPPKVMSGVIRLVRRVPEPAVDFQALRRVVKAAFNQRRKTLRNALSGLDFQDFPERAHIWTQRAEQLSLDAFALLAAQVISGADPGEDMDEADEAD